MQVLTIILAGGFALILCLMCIIIFMLPRFRISVLKKTFVSLVITALGFWSSERAISKNIFNFDFLTQPPQALVAPPSTTIAPTITNSPTTTVSPTIVVNNIPPEGQSSKQQQPQIDAGQGTSKAQSNQGETSTGLDLDSDGKKSDKKRSDTVKLKPSIKEKIPKERAQEGKMRGQLVRDEGQHHSGCYDTERTSKMLDSDSQEKAADQFRLGWMYANGCNSVGQNDYQAVEWYKMAAAQGYVPAQINLGWMLSNGRGVEKDDRQALEWYRKAAKLGDPVAQFNMGVMCDEGRGLSSADPHQAAEWYKKAAKQDYDPAKNNLGWMYENGRGVDKDFEQARYWYKKAADHKESSGQYNLERIDNLVKNGH